MAIYRPFVNVTITAIERPSLSGIGGKVVLETLLVANIVANRQPFNAFATAGDFMVRDENSALARADNTFWIDLKDAAGLVTLVKAGDLVSWASINASGPTSHVTKDEVVRLNIWEQPGFLREHVEIVVRGNAA